MKTTTRHDASLAILPTLFAAALLGCGSPAADDAAQPLAAGTAAPVPAPAPFVSPTLEPSVPGLRCAPGTADCDGDLENGCETRTDDDPDDCGRCGNTCSLQACGAGACADVVAVVSDQHALGPFAPGADGVYYFDGEELRVAPRNGASPRALATASAEGAVHGLALDDAGGFAYWGDGAGVMRTETITTETHAIASEPSSVVDVAASGADVYYATREAVVAMRGDVETSRLVLGELLAPSSVQQVVADGCGGFFGATTALARGAVGSIDRRTRVLVDGVPASVALDESHLYWLDARGGAIWRMDKDGGGARQLVADPAPPGETPVFGQRLVQRAGSLYWIVPDRGEILRMPVDASAAPAVVARGQAHAEALRAGDDGVYWAEEGRVIRLRQ